LNVRLILIGLLFGSLSLIAQGADAPSSIELKYKLPTNSAYSYQTVIKLSGQVKAPNEPQPETLTAQLDMRHRMKVASTDAKGDLVIENHLYNLKLKNGDTTSSVAESATIAMTLAPNGKVLETRGLDTLSQANGLPGMDATTFSSLLYNLPTFPSKSVKAGDAWSDEVPVQLPTGQKAMAQRKVTLVSVGKEKDGQPSAQIKTEMSLPISLQVAGANGGTLTGFQSGVGASKIALADGLPLESHSDIKMQITVKPATPATDAKGKPADSSVQVTTSIQIDSKRVPDEPPPAKKAEDQPDAHSNAQEKTNAGGTTDSNANPPEKSEPNPPADSK
jgi:hypothetical protein